MEKGADTVTKNNSHNTKIRVRYKDTDRMGVVYYGNYLTFFEVARSEFMRDLGLPYTKFVDNGFDLAVSEAKTKYHGNVGYDSLITVRSRIMLVKKVRVRFDYEVYDENDTLLVTGYTVHACINLSKKPTRLPLELRKIIDQKKETEHE